MISPLLSLLLLASTHQMTRHLEEDRHQETHTAAPTDIEVVQPGLDDVRWMILDDISALPGQNKHTRCEAVNP